MGKKSPNLQLITKERRLAVDERLLARLNVRNFAELSDAERKRVERMIALTAPGAGVAGVSVGKRAWDLRPIVVIPSEAAQGASLIRFLGPEVTLSIPLTARITENLQRLSNSPSGDIIQWGVVEGQLWYRRTLIRGTLAERLLDSRQISFRDTIEIAEKLIEAVGALHQLGVVHGHLVSENIALSSEGDLTLLDAGVALAIVQANAILGIDEPVYDLKLFAPEATTSENANAALDRFGVGKLLGDLLGRVERGTEEDHILDSACVKITPEDARVLSPLIGKLMSENSAERPTLDVVRRAFAERKTRGADQLSDRFSSRGRIIRSSQPGGIGTPPPPVLAELSGRAVPRRPSSTSITRMGLEGSMAPEDRPSAPPRMAQQPPYHEMPGVSPGPNYEAHVPYHEESFHENGSLEPAFYRADSLRAEAPLEFPPETRLFSFANILLGIAFLAVTFLGYRLWTEGQESIGLTPNELRAAWESSLPSEMSGVVLAAIDAKDPNKFAEHLILRAAFRGDHALDSRSAQLIRTAFDRRWEANLSQTDRRVAITIAFGKLLGARLPRERVDLASLHPGVVLAILASLSDPPGLGEIPASRLAQLPPPLGIGFQELLDVEPRLGANDPAIKQLARLGTNENLNVEEIINFLREDPPTRLRALAQIFSLDQKAARDVLHLVLLHPNIKLDHEIVRWGTTFSLTEWSDLSSNDQLFVLAGIVPAKQVSPKEAVQLLAHPAAALRRYAIEIVLNSVKLSHPAAVRILTQLKDNPNLLQPKQTLKLAQFLEGPDRAAPEDVREWLDSSPPTVIIEAMLLGSAQSKKATALDAQLSTYLQKVGWQPSEETLSMLITHPDRLTRLFGYTKCYESRNIRLLEEAYDKETAVDLKQHLELMLSSLRAESK